MSFRIKLKYNRTTNCIFNLGYHIIWCPKFRANFLLNLDQKFLKRTFEISAIKVRGVIENIEIMPDHIHIFIQLKQNHLPISKIVQILKGFSSYTIRKKYKWMQKYKSLWSPSYFVESIGNMSEKVIKKYIDNQKINLKPTYKYKLKVLKDKQINNNIHEKAQKRFPTMFCQQFKVS